LLPALPSKWPKGEVQGLRARGAFEVDIKWQSSAVTEAKIQSLAGKKCQVTLLNAEKYQVLDAVGNVVKYQLTEGRFSFDTSAGQSYRIVLK